MTRIVNRRRNLADQCDACFYDWHEECREHRILGECCCGFEDGFDDEPNENATETEPETSAK